MTRRLIAMALATAPSACTALSAAALATALSACAIFSPAALAFAANAVADESGTVALTDTVHYSGLVEGDAYTATVALVDAATGLTLRDSTGAAVAQSVTFVPTDAYGTVSVDLQFQMAATSDGASVTAWESVTKDGTEVLRHTATSDPITLYLEEPEPEEAETSVEAASAEPLEQTTDPVSDTTAESTDAAPMPQTGAVPTPLALLASGTALAGTAIARKRMPGRQ